jgi:2-polyprenyl-6-methoxyphenol hydroxylase-like FAD-dependent oxidoreductase
VIVGGGPTGSALALKLSRAGRSVRLIDAGASSQKICGEGLLPAAWRILTDLGLDHHLPERAAIEGISYGMTGPAGELRTVSADLKMPAFGVQRGRLMAGFSKALDASGVEISRGTRLRDLSLTSNGVRLQVQSTENGSETIDANMLIGADGLHSMVRRKSELQSGKPRRYARWGARCYFRSQEQRHRVEVTLGSGLESYLTPLGKGLYGLAFLWSPARLGKPLPGEGKVWERLLGLMGPEMQQALPKREGELLGEDRAIGPLQQQVKSPLHSSHRIALVGDAAGYLDALTGEGLCLGLRQADSLAGCILNGRISDYPREHRKIKFRHQLTVSGLLWLVHHPKLRERVFGALIQAPSQFEALLQFAVEEAGWLSLLNSETFRFLKALLKGT